MRNRSGVAAVVALFLLFAPSVRAEDTPRQAADRRSADMGYLAQQMALHTAYLREDEPTAPHYWVSVGLLALDRELIGDPDLNLVFTSSGVNGPGVLALRNLNFDNESGLRVTFGHRHDAWSSIEATYSGQQSWATRASVSDPNGRLFGVVGAFGTVQQPQFPSPPNPPTSGFTNNSTFQGIGYGSKMQTGEINLVRDAWMFDIGRSPATPWREMVVSWIGGARFLKLDERFSYNTRGSMVAGMNDPDARFDYLTEASNRMFGPQVGLRSRAHVRRKLSLGGEGRVALMANAGEQKTLVQTFVGLPAPTPGLLFEKQADIRPAVLYQLGLWVDYHLSRSLSVRAGYDFLRLDGRVLAPRQFDTGAVLRNALAPINDDEGATHFDGYSVATTYRF